MIRYFFPGIREAVHRFQAGNTNIPVAVGLIVMMYPNLVSVAYWRKRRHLLYEIKAVTGFCRMHHRPRGLET